MEKTSIYPVHRKVYVAWPSSYKLSSVSITPATQEKKGFVAYPKKTASTKLEPQEVSRTSSSFKEGLFVAYPGKGSAVNMQNTGEPVSTDVSTPRTGYVAYPTQHKFSAMVRCRAVKAILHKKVAGFKLAHLLRLKAS